MSKDASRIKLTAARVDGFTCPPGKSQAFLWDTVAPSLLVRATPTGRKTYAFEGRLNGKTLRVGIGTATDWTLDKARQRAAELKMLVDGGQDPRELEQQEEAKREAKRQHERAEAVTVGEVWAPYLEERRSKWGETYLQDHYRYAQAGGEPVKRGKGFTKPGPLHPLMHLRLADMTPETVTQWAESESAKRPTVTRNAWRVLRAFLTWCSEHKTYSAVMSASNPAKARKVKEAVGKPGVKDDALQREQLPAWFQAVQQLSNPTIAAYLQTLLLTGARPGEVLAVKWDDVNTKWKGLTIRDKVEGERVIPLTAYVHHLIAALPRRNEYVFASNRTDEAITDPNHAHDRACKVAGIDGLTLHGLRRSFSTLTEWLEIPAGVVAQIQGHKPSATAEKHYKRRPLDLLRVHHERIEAWILEQAGVQFDRASEPSKLRVVA
jgi:integrase